MNKTERLLNKNSYMITRGHDFVEINGVKWATCNLGAENPEDPGLYFRWGDKKGYTKDFIESNNGKKPIFDVFYENIRDFFDVVRFLWGGKWRMPTPDEFLALNRANKVTHCFKDITCKVFNSNCKSVIFPFSGAAIEEDISLENISAYYWTKEGYDGTTAKFACIDDYITVGHASNNYGFNIRPVLDI